MLGTLRARIERHPKLWGLLFAILLGMAYFQVVRPVRYFVAEHVAYPALQAVETQRAEAYTLLRIDRRPAAVWALPRSLAPTPPQTDAEADALVREHEAAAAQWVSPVGVMFIMPALFLIALFPSRPYWLWLLGYHVVIGVGGFVVFAVGLAWLEPAFKVYLFSRTYLTESISLAVPLLIALAAHSPDSRQRKRQQT
jgi:hypothetical protein